LDLNNNDNDGEGAYWPMINDPWVICVSLARKLGMQQEKASHRAARVDRDGSEARHANNNDDDNGVRCGLTLASDSAISNHMMTPATLLHLPLDILIIPLHTCMPCSLVSPTSHLTLFSLSFPFPNASCLGSCYQQHSDHPELPNTKDTYSPEDREVGPSTGLVE